MSKLLVDQRPTATTSRYEGAGTRSRDKDPSQSNQGDILQQAMLKFSKGTSSQFPKSSSRTTSPDSPQSNLESPNLSPITLSPRGEHHPFPRIYPTSALMQRLSLPKTDKGGSGSGSSSGVASPVEWKDVDRSDLKRDTEALMTTTKSMSGIHGSTRGSNWHRLMSESEAKTCTPYGVLLRMYDSFDIH